MSNLLISFKIINLYKLTLLGILYLIKSIDLLKLSCLFICVFTLIYRCQSILFFYLLLIKLSDFLLPNFVICFFRIINWLKIYLLIILLLIILTCHLGLSRLILILFKIIYWYQIWVFLLLLIKLNNLWCSYFFIHFFRIIDLLKIYLLAILLLIKLIYPLGFSRLVLILF